MDHIAHASANSHKPLYQQIYWHIKNAVASRVLQAGDRIPSARAIAKEWGVARGTAEEAYQLLKDEGIVIAKGPAGCFIAAPVFQLSESPPPLVEATSTSPTAWFQSRELLPFHMGIPALDVFPIKRWQRIGRALEQHAIHQNFCNPHRQGVFALREQVSKYLAVARGVDASPEQIFITGGYRQSLTLIAHAIEGNRHAWIEDPGYPPTRSTLEALGYSCTPIAVDHQGMQVALGRSSAPDANLCVVTPAHQSPLCCHLTLPRRQQLLQWARDASSWIIEDDYDGEYRLAGRPLPSLKSLDINDRVIYMGTFSKVLIPSIRIAYVVIPRALVDTVTRTQQALMDSQPFASQQQIAQFMVSGQFVRHIQKMRKLYRERRATCVDAFHKVFGNSLRIDDQPGGMHFIARYDAGIEDQTLAQRCLDAGIYANPLSYWCINNHQQGLLMSYTNVANQETIIQHLHTLKSLFDKC